MKWILILGLSLMGACAQAGEPTLTPLWETEGFAVPESVLMVGTQKEGYMFVSQIEGSPSELDGKGAIAKVAMDGVITHKDWVTGLNAPKGMATFAGKLIVADVNSVVIIDIAKATIEQRIEVPGAVFLNDVAVNASGHIFVSDTRTQKVHRIIDGKQEVFLESVEGANGLTFVDGHLYVAGGAVLWQVTEDQSLKKIAEGFAENADGVERVGPQQFIVSCWAGLVYFVDNGKLTMLLDTREQKKNTADIGWNPAQKLVYVPTFSSGSVVAYAFEVASGE